MHNNNELEPDIEAIKSKAELEAWTGIAILVAIGLLLLYWIFIPNARDVYASEMDSHCYNKSVEIVGYENRTVHDFEVDKVYQHDDGNYTVLASFMSFTPSIDLYHVYYAVCDIEHDEDGNQKLKDYEMIASLYLLDEYLATRKFDNSKTL